MKERYNQQEPPQFKANLLAWNDGQMLIQTR